MKNSTNKIVCMYFSWNLFSRCGVFYADGRHNRPSLGRHSLGTRDRAEAMEMLRALDRRKAIELRLIEPEADTPSDELLIERTWQRYLDHVARPDVLGGAGPRTVKRYRAVRDKHTKFCAERRVVGWRTVDARHVVAYGDQLSKAGYSDASVYLECTLLKQLVKWLVEEDKSLPASQQIRLVLRRSEDSTTFCYTAEQVTAMRELCRADPELRWMADIIVALASTGMRIGELAELRWSDVDLATGIIILSDNRHCGKAQRAGAVRTTKGRRSRRIDIHPQLRAMLVALPRRADGRIFGGPKGGPVRPDKVLKVLKRDVIGPLKQRFPTPTGEIGFEHGGVHSFRHYFVTEAFLGGATEAEVMDWVGHRDSRIVRRYRHLRADIKQRRMQELAFFGRAPAMDETTNQAANAAKEVSSRGPSGGVTNDKEGGAVRPGVPAEAAAPNQQPEAFVATENNV